MNTNILQHIPIPILLFLAFLTGSVEVRAEAPIDSCDQLTCQEIQVFTLHLGDSIPVGPGLLLDDPWCPDGEYRILYEDNRGREVELDYIHAGLRGEVEVDILNVTYGLICQTKLIVQVHGCGQLFRPDIEFRRFDIECHADTDPMSIGLPIPDTAQADEDLVVTGWNLCEDIQLRYVDWVTFGDCDDQLDMTITRRWEFQTDDGRQFGPVDTIYVHNAQLPEADTLLNYDGVEAPILNCEDDWNDGSNIPGIEVTAPDFGDATNCINVTYDVQDSIIEQVDRGCYHYAKFIRNTTVFEWCSEEVKEYHQLVVVECGEDIGPPVAICHSDLTVSVRGDDTTWISVDGVDKASYDDCGIETYSFSLDSIQTEYPITRNDDGITLTMYITDYFGKVNSCDVEINVRFFSSTNDLNASNWNIYPNPTSTDIFIESKSGSQLQSLTWMDRLGRELKHVSVDQLQLTGSSYRVALPKRNGENLLFLQIETRSGDVFVKKVIHQSN